MELGKMPVALRTQANVHAHYVTSCTQYDTGTQASIHAHCILMSIAHSISQVDKIAQKSYLWNHKMISTSLCRVTLGSKKLPQ